MKRFVFAVGLVLAVLAAGVAGWSHWRRNVVAAQDARWLEDAQSAMKAGRTADALQLVAQRPPVEADDPVREAAWTDVQVESCAAGRHMIRLAALYDAQPAAVMRNEDASILMVRLLQERRRDEAAGVVRAAWRGRETRKGAWLAADADALIRRGARDAALAMLEAGRLEGREDCARLLRLALLNASDARKSSELLDAAFCADPGNPDVRSFRAQLFESTGRPEWARAEYAAAAAAQPDNPLLTHQLAEFYRRLGNATLANQAWAESIRRGTLDFIWLRAWFWSHVAQDAGSPWRGEEAPPGSLNPLCRFVAALPTGRLWDEPAFMALPGARQFATEHQEVRWLRTLQSLRNGDEDAAAELLRDSAFSGTSWDTGLEWALAAVYAGRHSGRAGAIRLDARSPGNIAGRHPFFALLGADGMSADRDRLLATGREAYAVAFLAAGWMEAALFLHDPAADLAALPEWATYGFAQALRQCRGPGPAIEFLRGRPESPLLSMLAGELHLAAGAPEKARPLLEPLSAADTPQGRRAALLLALERLSAGAPAAAEAAVGRNPALAAAAEGREILARCALARGSTNEAVRLFEALGDASPVAQDFLAARAFAEGRLDEAETRTRALLERHPDEPRYLANLRGIAAARTGSASPAHP